MSLRTRICFRIYAPVAALVLCTAFFLGSAWSGTGPSSAQLTQTRIDAASKAFTLNSALYKAGATTPETVYLWSTRWLESQGGRKAGAGPVDDHLKRMQGLEAVVKANFQSGSASGADNAAATYYRAEAEQWAFDAHGGQP